MILLETPRLRLRQFTPADVDDLVVLDSDPEVMHFITGGLPTSRAEIADVILPAWLAWYERSPALGFWAAEDRASGEFLGWFHLRPGEGRAADEPELGYRLRRDSWGRGLASEGSQALVDLAFERGGARRVVAETMLVHAASRRVMEKVGMRLVREFHADWPYAIPGDERGDVEYAIERSEWEHRGVAGRWDGDTVAYGGPMSDFLYSVEREFDIPVDILWAAWTDPVALEAWYHPTDLSVVPGSVISDAVEGGLWTVGVDVPAHGFVAYFYGRYTAVVENARLEHTMAYTQSADEFAARDEAVPHHRILIEFESRAFRSWVRFSQFGELPEGQAAQAQAGMESYFDSLEAYLA